MCKCCWKNKVEYKNVLYGNMQQIVLLLNTINN